MPPGRCELYKSTQECVHASVLYCAIDNEQLYLLVYCCGRAGHAITNVQTYCEQSNLAAFQKNLNRYNVEEITTEILFDRSAHACAPADSFSHDVTKKVLWALVTG